MSDFEKPDREIVSSSELSSSAFPKKTTSEEPGRDHSQPLESLKDDSVSESDSVGIEVSRLGTLESEKLDCHPETQERWVWNSERLGEYVGLHLVSCPVVCQSVDVDVCGARRESCARTVNIVIAYAPYSRKLYGTCVCCHHMPYSLHRLIFCTGWFPHKFFTEYGHHPTVDAHIGMRK